MSRARQLVEIAIETGIMIATAESCTGGGITAAITDIAGSSAVLDRGFVTYTNAAKIEMLGVSGETLAAHGAVSEQVAREMAAGALARSHAQIAVSVTGIAGPGGSEHKPEGRVCFGIATATQTAARTHDFGPIGRAHVRRASVEQALQLMIDEITRLPKL
ncbi:CinA family protein [Oceaniglobus ichthyenteri]|uniref:CinA family protein n=1 Tax=Oceaniglobus ichthyenteri TaxID=2136177 RepID=UPI000D39AC66|nr:CinA family protein [Oceaniglobus ichthyenteri]